MTIELEKRIDALENWSREINISRAREEVDRKHIDLRFDALEAKLKEINATARQLTYFIASAVIVYIVTFIMNGGLSLTKAG